ncbi:MAG: hypothetical protein AAF412_09415 [Pseudomonadota bacterium]
MNPRRLTEFWLKWTKSNGWLVVAMCFVVFAFAMPWEGFLDVGDDSVLLGIPVGFLLKFLGLPVAMVLIAAGFITLAEDNDRHHPDYENE